MRLVDGEERDRRALEQRQRAVLQQALRRDVEQVELAGANARSTACCSGQLCEELRKAARTPASFSASTWSCMSAMSGETTTPVPARTSAGIW